ncbi:non-canonical purine NTP pyrophosphatase [Halolamina sp. CBA1230]|uniref:non-canonical purine NTP pyrophosphatase n=1 Tax=Halolamina sp. CBA1230 TaxID=1853690 RepID=UPI0009A1B7E2|nr:non-canonical purine NTP pyrophosphatase [Halolamina sp. CBA1230]QKY21023.1 non-canonical purine NTP pyrophosphatase [Halolamina sp. CBA1230]
MLRYVTTNPGKVREAEEYLGDDSVAQLDYDYTEIQSDDLGTIAARGAREAYRHAGEPALVDDAGLFVRALDGFPGPYSSYVEDTVGIERTWELASAEEDRAASFRCVLAYCDGEGFDASPDPVDKDDRVAAAAAGPDEDDEAEALPVKLFEGRVRGTLVEPRGEGGFGFDPIFEHEGTTFAEMSEAEKNAISHRGRALAKFGEWYAER